MARPALVSQLAADEFGRFYWLKAELLTFCRAHQLATQGGKRDLEARIATFLATGERAEPAVARAEPNAMPTRFTRATVIGANWRCTQALRAFFAAEIGPRFHFDGVMREYIHHNAGKTLQNAIDAWQQPRATSTIAPQFEYNRHMRAFFAANPHATREQAIQAWNEAKAQRRAPLIEE